MTWLLWYLAASALATPMIVAFFMGAGGPHR